MGADCLGPLLEGQVRNVVFKQPLLLPHAESGDVRWRFEVGRPHWPFHCALWGEAACFLELVVSSHH